MKLENIMALARKFARTHTDLRDCVQRIQDQQRACLDRKRLHLMAKLRAANLAQAELVTAILAHPELFEERRTVIVDGIKFGMTTRKGGYDIPNEETIIGLLKTRFRSTYDTFVRRKESLVMDALDSLTDDELKEIGVYRKPDDKNAPVARATEGAVDKIVLALLDKELPA